MNSLLALYRRLLRFAVWLAGGLVVVLLLAAVGVGLYTRTDHFHRLLREQILATLQGMIDGEVTLEQVSGSVWEALHLHGLSIRQNGVEVVSVPHGVVA